MGSLRGCFGIAPEASGIILALIRDHLLLHVGLLSDHFGSTLELHCPCSALPLDHFLSTLVSKGGHSEIGLGTIHRQLGFVGDHSGITLAPLGDDSGICRKI